jgi:2-amino-4-hydroxy-6-hydroxymethyldihydropteridine diphosphokinase
MHTIFLALGTNIADKKKHIEDAISLLEEEVHVIVRAPIYESKPVGFAEQENFYNTVLKGQTNLSPEKLLLFVKKIEKKIGRVERFRNGPREIDIDILLYDDLVLNTEHLIIPHPRMQERDFVLQPLADINPEIKHPIVQKTIKDLFHEIPTQEKAILRKV